MTSGTQLSISVTLKIPPLLDTPCTRDLTLTLIAAGAQPTALWRAISFAHLLVPHLSLSITLYSTLSYPCPSGRYPYHLFGSVSVNGQRLQRKTYKNNGFLSC